jgi:transcriptional regulator with XRE-family HTH domain
MPSPDLVVEAVKACVRVRLSERGWRYRDLADAVGVSEVTIKRWMTADDLSLSRVGRVAEALGLTAFELLRLAQAGEEQTFLLSEAVEQALVSDREAHVAWEALRLGRDPEAVRVHYGHAPADWFRLLGRLEALGLVERHAGDRVRLQHHGIHNWLADGPLRDRYHDDHVAWVSRAWAGDGSLVQAATRVVGDDFLADAEGELLTLARRWRGRAWRDQVARPVERQQRVRWMLVLSRAPDWPEP